MTNMIERVADAIMDQHDTYHSTFLDSARAAIAAMREPTENMVASAEAVAAVYPTEHWKAMIDAALEEM
jgi:hypothetical protein